jgi:hypothetical protein
MRRPSPRSKLIIAVAAAAIAGGGAAALLARSRDGSDGGRGARAQGSGSRATRTGSASAGSGDIAVAARYLGVPPARVREELRSHRPLAEIADRTPGHSSAGLVDALVKARTARLAAAVAEGRIDKAQERRRLAPLRARVVAKVEAVPHLVSAAPGDVSVAASYLGVCRAQLRLETRAGPTLAQIAEKTPGKSARGLIDALVAARRSRLAAAVASGAISRKQQKSLEANLEKRVTERVNRRPRHTA